MAKLTTKTKENPKLQEKLLADGRKSLYLEYYLGRQQWTDEKTDKVKVKHDRRKESLNLYLIAKPRTPIEKQTNDETLTLAKKIRFEREQQMKEDRAGYRLKSNKKINIFDFMQSYYDSYTKGDKRMIKAAIKRFKDFIAIEYPIYKNSIAPEQLNKDMMMRFVEYLQSISKGEGALTHYKRFKKIIKYGVEHDVIRKNPCNGVVCKGDENALVKDVLSLEEMEQLQNTKYDQQNPNLRRAFLFCLYTGIRFCDVNELVYSDVDYSNRMITFNQKKTQGASSKSWVTIPLNNGLLSLIGEQPKDEKNNSINTKIFNLPSQSMCLRSLRHWVKLAGINKHITWHCARHSFAVNILNNGANIKTVASLLGHSGLQHTEKYTRAVDSLKQAAIDSLPEIKM
ncbi:site-specific recombinase XerD [Dysgonomonas alginatilytica]|uniref:Site-specific recombinase XerD n=1 Tax=Dysgonomonas alginatilytica TaxID=1605892 RepID=A0A2V3PKQ9_9BACT|nr:site-specific integrase [Dysgonomonas alginatilytica]PXV62066.1 site-specific recombinase XerD [Dysgonomonas alginatilytica]